MKKIISLFVSFIMLLTLFPFSALAVEDSNSSYEALINLACEVFPEYESAIRGENINTYARSAPAGNDKVVHRESRAISDTETMSIAMYASGNVIVLRNNNTSTISLTSPSSSTNDISTIGVAGTASFEVASNQYGYFFKLSDVAYTIYYSGSDYFSSYGTPYSQLLYKCTAELESSTQIQYTLHVTAKDTEFHIFKLYFENDQLIAEAE